MLYQLSYFRKRKSVVGADGFEPPKSKDSRFTVCPIWPLWNTPGYLLFSLKPQSNLFS